MENSITRKCAKCSAELTKRQKEYCLRCQKAMNKKRWKTNHPEKVKEEKRKYNKSLGHQISKLIWRLTHAEEIKAQRKEYNQRTTDKRLEYNRNRRAKIKGSQGKISRSEWNKLVEMYQGKCLYPGCDRTDVTMDHVVPLALGGSHTIDNVQPLCEHHNKSKHAKHIDYRPTLERNL